MLDPRKHQQVEGHTPPARLPVGHRPHQFRKDSVHQQFPQRPPLQHGSEGPEQLQARIRPLSAARGVPVQVHGARDPRQDFRTQERGGGCGAVQHGLPVEVPPHNAGGVFEGGPAFQGGREEGRGKNGHHAVQPQHLVFLGEFFSQFPHQVQHHGGAAVSVRCGRTRRRPVNFPDCLPESLQPIPPLLRCREPLPRSRQVPVKCEAP
mmetsp:Transcript_3630/g.5280  ORF Transcript_3630/g.5280 Transcript_3630/m.5280 type:complete len:207 (-) Transcript_3630:269-889(-)